MNPNAFYDNRPYCACLRVEAVNHLRVRSCLIDGEAVFCNDDGLSVFEKMRRRRGRARVPLRIRLARVGREGHEARAV
jgi:ATP-dependent DNA ligase